MSKNTKKQQAQQTKNTAALNKAASIDLTKTLTSLTSAGVQIQGTLSQMAEELIQKHAELQAVDDAIALKKTEMETLHGVDQVLLTIDEARALHAETLNKMEQQRKDLQQQYDALRTNLEQQRQREAEEFQYKLTQNRKADADAWLEQIRVRGIAERDRVEKFEKNLAEREGVLRAQEQAYQAAISKAATFEDELKKATSAEVAKVTGALTKDFKHQQELASMQNATQIEKLRFDNERLVQAASNYEAQNKELSQQLKDAYLKINELAAKTVEAANNKQAQADALALMTNIGTSNGSRPRS